MFSLKEERQNQLSSYDQSHLDVKISHGRSQLQEIKVQHSWTSPAIKLRLPKLTCQWFNKTDSSMEIIPGVTEDTYQPSIIDVGTSIYVQVLPESKDLEYEGMPISKFTNPIQLATETEEQTKELFDAGKSTFFIELKELYLKEISDQDQQAVEGKVPIKECLLKIVKDKLLLFGKTSAMQKADVLLTSQIGAEYPQLQIDRTCGRFLNVLFNAEEFAIVVLQNNKIRDILYLLVKMVQEQETQIKIEKQLEPETQSNQTSTIEAHIEIKDNNEKILSQQNGQSKPLEQPIANTPQPTQKQSNEPANIIIISELRNKLIKTEYDCNKYLKEVVSLKQKLKHITQFNNSLSKNLQEAQQKLLKVKEQLKSASERQEKELEEMCYLKNQCRLLEEKNISLSIQCDNLRKKYTNISESLKLSETERIKFGQFANLQLTEALSLLVDYDQQLKDYRLKNDYLESQIENYQQEIILTKQQHQQLEGSNKHLTKKVESLMEAQSKLKIQASTAQNEQARTLNFIISKQKQEYFILQASIEPLHKEKTILKLQIKDLIEENTCLRSREKGSKHQLKLEVVELKKLVNRFTQMITEKDVEIQNLKLANKTLNKALLQGKK